MKKCENLVKENYNVYMIDNDAVKLDLEDDFKIQSYEKFNKVKVTMLVNDFLKNNDKNFEPIISMIEKLVAEHKIDYFMYGEGKEVSDENLAIIYNLKNRSSCVDCNLKVFYNADNKHMDKLRYMIQFSEGTNGDSYGFTFYRFFRHDDFYKIIDPLKKYFSSDSRGIEDRKVIEDCILNIKNRLDYYYSE